MRTRGALNQSHQQKRERILAKIHKDIANQGLESFGMRQFARSAGTSVNTLQHYFGTQHELTAALFERIHQSGSAYTQAVPLLARLPVKEALVELLSQIVGAWRPGALQHLHRLGIHLGLGDPKVGSLYIDNVLEPTLQAVETLLLAFQKSGALSKTMNPRFASLALMSPILLALLHQNDLEGRRCRPLDLNALVDAHAKAFVRGWSP